MSDASPPEGELETPVSISASSSEMGDDASSEGEGKKAAKPARKRAKAKGAPAEPKAEDAGAGEDGGAEKKTRAKKAPSVKKPAVRKKAAAAKASAAEPAAAPARQRASKPTRRRVVRAHARYVRTSARKARMVCGHLRGKSVEEARAILAFTPREVARDWSKLLESAVANAESNHELLEDDLVVREAYADEGPTIKRFRPRAMGRATPIRKRTSHLTITLMPRQ
jgi:ribosomal protein L22